MIKIFNGSEFKNFIKIKSDKKVSNFNDGLNSAVADIINNVKIISITMNIFLLFNI